LKKFRDANVKEKVKKKEIDIYFRSFGGKHIFEFEIEE